MEATVKANAYLIHPLESIGNIFPNLYLYEHSATQSMRLSIGYISSFQILEFSILKAVFFDHFYPQLQREIFTLGIAEVDAEFVVISLF